MNFIKDSPSEKSRMSKFLNCYPLLVGKSGKKFGAQSLQTAGNSATFVSRHHQHLIMALSSNLLWERIIFGIAFKRLRGDTPLLFRFTCQCNPCWGWSGAGDTDRESYQQRPPFCWLVEAWSSSLPKVHPTSLGTAVPPWFWLPACQSRQPLPTHFCNLLWPSVEPFPTPSATLLSTQWMWVGRSYI
jgi:hypothetical protein